MVYPLDIEEMYGSVRQTNVLFQFLVYVLRAEKKKKITVVASVTENPPPDVSGISRFLLKFIKLKIKFAFTGNV